MEYINSSVSEEWAVPAPLVASTLPIMIQIRWQVIEEESKTRCEHKAMFGFSFYSHLFWRWLFMIFLIIHVYWCSIRFPYKKTLVSFNSNTHVTSEAGTLPFVPVVWWGSCWSVFILLFFCVVFCRLLFVFFVIFLLVIALSILWVMTSDYPCAIDCIIKRMTSTEKPAS
jgi:hypothetical protein